MADSKNRVDGDDADFAPLMLHEQVAEFEAEYEHTWGSKRRMAMTVLTQSRSELTNGFGQDSSDPATLLDLVNDIKEYADHLAGGAQLANAAIARLLLVAGAGINGPEVDQ